MSTRLPMPHALVAVRPLALASFAVTILAACGGGGGGGTEQCTGDFCPCETVLDCPNPGEQCIANTCLPGAGDTSPDVTPDADASTDAEPDTSPDADTSPDTTPDADDTTPDGTPDADDTSPDTTPDTAPDVEPDVGPTCGDGTCDEGVEDCSSCQADCGECAPFCGDGTCDEGIEVCDVCIDDCGACPIPVVENPWIAFTTRGSVAPETGLEQLYIIRADGTGLGKYNGNDNYERSPAWTNDGTRLVYLGIRLGLETRQQLRIVDFVEDTFSSPTHPFVAIANPGWLADGIRIVVEARETGATRNSIYIISTADGTVTRLTNPPGSLSDAAPFPSPTGDFIYFVRGEGSNFDVYRIAPDGTGESRVTTGSRITGGPSIDYTGGFLMYSSAPTNPDLPSQLRRRNIVTRAETNFGLPGDTEPAFFGDGSRIALMRRPEGAPSSEVVIVSATTGEIETQLTANSQPDYSPAVGNIESDELDVSTFFDLL